MLKSIVLYRIDPSWAMPNPAVIEDALGAGRFTHCGPTQVESRGWVEPRGHAHGALLESVSGQYIFTLRTETRAVPASAVKDLLAERVAAITQQTGRKPGSKEKRELKDEIVLELLPRAFTKSSDTMVWIDPVNKILAVDSSSISKSDKVVTAIVDVFSSAADGIMVSLLGTNTSPSTAMSHWLVTKEAPYAFSVDRECELKAPDESKASVKYSRHSLELDEIVEHIRHGKVATQLAMTWNDRVSFVLTEHMVVKKIELVETAIEDAENAQGDKDEDNFDADVAIVTGELSQLIPDLLLALDGELVLKESVADGSIEASAKFLTQGGGGDGEAGETNEFAEDCYIEAADAGSAPG